VLQLLVQAVMVAVQQVMLQVQQAAEQSILAVAVVAAVGQRERLSMAVLVVQELL
jgi:hypothetical protein